MKTYGDSKTAEPFTVCYYFFQADVADAPITALRSLLAQLFDSQRQHHELIDKFVFVMSEMGDGQLVASPRELVDLLRLVLQYVQNPVAVIDGVDECIDPNSFLIDLTESGFGTSHRTLLFSRINVSQLSRRLPQTQSISMDRRSISDDTRFFLQRSLTEFVSDELLPENSNISMMTDRLVSGADGMWLWARLMIRYLSSVAFTSFQRLQAITSVTSPEGLDSMYLRIFKRISTAVQIEQEFACRVFMWLSLSHRMLKALELREALASLDLDESHDHKHSPAEFRHAVLMTCMGLVEPDCNLSDTHQAEYSFRFMHHSAKEYVLNHFFSDRQAKGGQFSGLPLAMMSHQQAHLQITTACLRFIRWRLPPRPLSGKPNVGMSQLELTRTYPFASYAAMEWIRHLSESCKDCRSPEMTSSAIVKSVESVVHDIGHILNQKFSVMVWIEAYLTATGKCPAPNDTQRLQSWCKWVISKKNPLRLGSQSLTVLNECIDFCRDLKSQHLSMGPSLTESPELIWGETNNFLNSKLLATSSAIRVTALAPALEENILFAKQPLFTISESAISNGIVGILSVWPSRSEFLLNSKI
jgi:hypothetical protein